MIPTCYFNITVTEPLQCNDSTWPVVDTNIIGASKRLVKKNENKLLVVMMIDKSIYNVDIVESIHENQMIGDTPNDIPCTTNAITVQGISYSDPYFTSFNLNYKMAFGAPKYMNKSDYAFNSLVRIPEPGNSLLLRHITKSKRIDDMTSTKHHDNNDAKDIDERLNLRFKNGDLTFAAMLDLTREEGMFVEEMRRCGLVDSWGVPRCLRLRGGGESSLNAASGWGSPPASNTGKFIDCKFIDCKFIDIL